MAWHSLAGGLDGVYSDITFARYQYVAIISKAHSLPVYRVTLLYVYCICVLQFTVYPQGDAHVQML